MYGLLWPQGQCDGAWSRSRPLHHGVGGVSDIPERNPSVYLLQRSPGIPSCGDQIRKRTIRDILSLLKDRMHRRGYWAATREGLEPWEEWWCRQNRLESYEEALRVACQRALDTTEALQGNIERLSQRARGRSWTHSQTHSQSCSRSCCRSRSRSHSRACSQRHPWGISLSKWPRTPSSTLPGRRVTFWEPEAEDYLLEPPVSNVETWLELQAQQLGTPAWRPELKAIPGVNDPRKLAHQIWASFYIPEVRMRASLGQEYTRPPAPKCLNRNTFLPHELAYQDICQQLLLLMVAYMRSLQYWAEKLKPPISLDLHPLAGSVVELRETVWEHVTFNHWDVMQG